MVKNLTDLCNKGAFNPLKWISKRRTVLASITEDSRAKEVTELDLDKDSIALERVLDFNGVWTQMSSSSEFQHTHVEVSP